VSSARGKFLEKRLGGWLEHPAPTAHRANRIRPEHSAYSDQDRVAAPLAQVLDADPAGELAAAHDLAGVFGQREKNSPLLCAQMPEGVGGIRFASLGETGHRSGAEH
jgi:hypothetical protein